MYKLWNAREKIGWVLLTIIYIWVKITLLPFKDLTAHPGDSKTVHACCLGRKTGINSIILHE